MSLLLDALKKSGENKPHSLNELELEEIQPAPRKPIAQAQSEPTSGSGISQNSLSPSGSLPPAPPSKTSSGRAAGENLFSAKKAPAKKRMKLGIVPIALITGGILGSGYGFYVYVEITPPNQRFWYSNPPHPQQVAAPVAPPVAPPRPAVVATAPALVPVTVATPPVAVADKPTVASEPQANSALQTNSSSQTNSAPAKKTTAHAPKTLRETPNTPGLNIQHQPEADSIDLILTSAYQAYQRGDFEAAGKHYRDALSKDQKNRDALLGLAAIAQQQGQDSNAVRYYRHVLELDPRDPVAQAALASFGSGDPSLKESHLKQLIAQQPDSAALNFALGNQYADQSRWAEAQQAYFNALAIEPSNALFAFNVAISLDHMGQRSLAAQYYRQALQFDTTGNSGFNRDQAQKRLTQLAAH